MVPITIVNVNGVYKPSYNSRIFHFGHIIESDDGEIYRKTLYLMVKSHGFPVKIFLDLLGGKSMGALWRFMDLYGSLNQNQNVPTTANK